MKTPMERAEDMSREKLEHIVGDLLACIDKGRLLDSTYGWEDPIRISGLDFYIPRNPRLSITTTPDWWSLR